MAVHATVTLTKTVEDLDKADDWFAEVKDILTGKTSCEMHANSSNREAVIEIKKD